MTLYRIITEDSDGTDRTRDFEQNITGTVSCYFDEFTIIKGTGFWKGSHENSIIVEIVATDLGNNPVAIREIAGTIKSLNQQEFVLVQMLDVEVSFV